MRVRGLKFCGGLLPPQNPLVAPYAGAWIEIALLTEEKTALSVAPYAGAWIEIDTAQRSWDTRRVAPYAGAWIEIFQVTS